MPDNRLNSKQARPRLFLCVRAPRSSCSACRIYDALRKDRSNPDRMFSTLRGGGLCRIGLPSVRLEDYVIVQNAIDNDVSFAPTS